MLCCLRLASEGERSEILLDYKGSLMSFASGYTLAGGYVFLTGQHGLAIDSLVAATVVTDTGEIIKTSGDNEPDLLWGIRGGGSNFGVVSSFTFRLHDQRPTVYFGRLSFHPDKLLDVFQAVRTWYASVPNPKSAVQVSFAGTKVRIHPPL
jgi:FAD/FMN-containing dehydrogenase